MKRTNYLYKTLLSLSFLLCVSACKKEIKDIPKVQEKMELKVSSANIALDENNPAKDILTFNWAPARAQSDDHMVSYTTKLDVVGNNFGSSTAIMTYEDDGVFSKSFTSEQLQNWANQKWGIPANKAFTLEFRIVAEWAGGATFEAPEVRTIRVTVQPIKTVVFEADKVFVDGTAVPGPNGIEMPKTLENLNQYAFVLDLEPGELQIPVEFNGKKNYIAAADANTLLKDGTAVDVKMRETPFSWKIETAGKYRVVVNMQKATATIYSAAQDLTPKSVVWTNNGLVTTTEVTDLWLHGVINGYGAPVKMNCTVSLADPQVLVYTGARVGKTKFILFGGPITNKDLAYAFSCPLTATGALQELTLVLGKVAELSGGTTSAQRNSYYTIPAGTNVLVLDLRNMTILAEKR
ncbi:SusE domain-containing protein [Pedobacter sp. MC2016-24]|uniref:SusE domain-containing protein n=1 Tax=Pedobacter sp. MC2016-24 TaxID=2780090 RepID=UPI00187FFDA5|nr:SusE domain-containing protein [Pedobacter sp. MC2016-24]MBE9598570.1 SusE domain-containing protein [Pedobacter sp. MC2016-24]